MPSVPRASRFVQSFFSSALALALIGLSGCAYLPRATPTPIPTKEFPATAGKRASTLVVFLPGRGDTMDDFERNGFLETLHRTRPEADAIVVDAHLGYYLNRSIVDRLANDVLQPARQKGYRRIVIVGISLGGLGSLLCVRDHADLVDNLVLIAPYLGDKSQLFSEIQSVGGPANWAHDRSSGGKEIDEEIWAFIGKNAEHLPPTWLFAGTGDRLHEGHQLFATLLPADHVTLIDGAHNWKTWRTLWSRACETSAL